MKKNPACTWRNLFLAPGFIAQFLNPTQAAKLVQHPGKDHRPGHKTASKPERTPGLLRPRFLLQVRLRSSHVTERTWFAFTAMTVLRACKWPPCRRKFVKTCCVLLRFSCGGDIKSEPRSLLSRARCRAERAASRVRSAVELRARSAGKSALTSRLCLSLCSTRLVLTRDQSFRALSRHFDSASEHQVTFVRTRAAFAELDLRSIFRKKGSLAIERKAPFFVEIFTCETVSTQEGDQRAKFRA